MMGNQLLSLRIPRRPQRKWVEKPLCRWSPLPPLAGREASSIDSSSSLRAQNPPQSEATLAPASNQPPKHPQQLPCRSEFVLPSKQIQLYTVFVGKRFCDQNPEQWVASAAWRQTPPNCGLCALSLPRGFVPLSDLGDRPSLLGLRSRMRRRRTSWRVTLWASYLQCSDRLSLAGSDLLW